MAFKYWQIPKDTPCLVFLSRLHPKKGIEFLLNAVAHCKINEVRLIIAGDGSLSYINELKTLCIELGVENQCRFIGFVDGQKKNILLQRADLFCLTSYSENFGISVLEAMANGTAPLISNQVALAAPINQHNLGVVCELNQSDINSKLNLALENLTKTRALGGNARRFVTKHYQWTDIAQSLSSLYKQISRDRNSLDR